MFGISGADTGRGAGPAGFRLLPGVGGSAPVVAEFGDLFGMGLGLERGIRKRGRIGALAGGLAAGLGRHGRRHSTGFGLNVLMVSLADAGRGAGPGIVHLLPGVGRSAPGVAEDGQRDTLLLRMGGAVRTGFRRNGGGVYDRAGLGAGRVMRHRVQFRVHRPGDLRIRRAYIIGHGRGVAVLIVAGPGEVHEFPGQGLEIDLHDHVVIGHLKAFAAEFFDEFGLIVLTVRFPEFDLVQYVILFGFGLDADRHQSRDRHGRFIHAVLDQICFAVAPDHLDLRQVVPLDVEVAAEGLPAGVGVAVRTEVERHVAGVIRIHDVVAGDAVVVMRGVRVPVRDLAVRDADDLDLVARFQDGVQIVFPGGVRVVEEPVGLVDHPADRSADQIVAVRGRLLFNDRVRGHGRQVRFDDRVAAVLLEHAAAFRQRDAETRGNDDAFLRAERGGAGVHVPFVAHEGDFAVGFHADGAFRRIGDRRVPVQGDGFRGVHGLRRLAGHGEGAADADFTGLGAEDVILGRPGIAGRRNVAADRDVIFGVYAQTDRRRFQIACHADRTLGRLHGVVASETGAVIIRLDVGIAADRDVAFRLHDGLAVAVDLEIAGHGDRAAGRGNDGGVLIGPVVFQIRIALDHDAFRRIAGAEADAAVAHRDVHVSVADDAAGLAHDAAAAAHAAGVFHRQVFPHADGTVGIDDIRGRTEFKTDSLDVHAAVRRINAGGVVYAVDAVGFGSKISPALQRHVAAAAVNAGLVGEHYR